ncbi:MAG TPA: hypothetical protein DCY30_03535 [Acidimicrobiaceae bacterium]|nr:hypothetical protein [Acidimicrobiaceae bacterium]
MMKFYRAPICIIVTCLLFGIAILACSDSAEAPSASDRSPHSSNESKEASSHDHDHDHGSSNAMAVLSPDQADVLIQIEYLGGEVITSETRVSVSDGDVVIFSIISDVDELIHVHGVDYLGEVSSGSSPSYLGFEAEVSGIFEVEFENSRAFITELLVK